MPAPVPVPVPVPRPNRNNPGTAVAGGVVGREGWGEGAVAQASCTTTGSYVGLYLKVGGRSQNGRAWM